MRLIKKKTIGSLSFLPPMTEDQEGRLFGGFASISSVNISSDNVNCENYSCNESRNVGTCTNDTCHGSINSGGCSNKLCTDTTTPFSPYKWLGDTISPLI